MQKASLLGMDVSLGTYEGFIQSVIEKAQSGYSHYACVANVHMLIETYKNSSFAPVVNGAMFITPRWLLVNSIHISA